MIGRLPRLVFSAVLGLTVATSSGFAVRPDQEEDVRRAVALADYIAGDYQAAVALAGGTILSNAEYQEMIDFLSLIAHYLGVLKVPAFDPLQQDLTKLHHSIEKKAPVFDVQKQAIRLRQNLVRHFSLPTAPQTLPDLLRGKTIFEQACSPCHGLDGRAKTEVAKQLDPPPRTFADEESLNVLSPFKAFNTITFGIEGTGMASFAMLSAADRWALASYVFTFRPNLPVPTQARPTVSWQEAMRKSDLDILVALQKEGRTEANALGELSQVRHLVYPREELLTGARSAGGKSALAGVRFARRSIRGSWQAFQKGQTALALNQAVNAYLDGFEASETVLNAQGERGLVAEVERGFITYRNAIRHEPKNVRRFQQELDETLQKAETILREQKRLSAWATLLGSFFILFREGLEAILLLAVILSILTSMRATTMIRTVHISWILALFAGGTTWFVAESIITGSVREGLEGWISLLAAGVLVYVSFWLLSKQDADRWKSFLVGKLTGKRGLGALTAGSVAFMAVYREAFETVLFFQALKLQAPGQDLWLWLGCLIAVASLLIVAWTIFYVGKRIPLNIFFGVSGGLLYFLAIVFLGQGIHSLQEADIISQTPVSFFTFSALGLFPYLESLLAQALFLSVFFASLLWQHWIKRPQVEEQLADRVTDASKEMYSIHELGEHLKEHLSMLRERLGKETISEAEIREMVEHMNCLDQEIHQMIMHLDDLQSGIPKRFQEIFREVQELAGQKQHEQLVKRSEAFKAHLDSLR